MFVSYINCYAWYLILMTFKMDFYQYNQIWALSFSIILNLRGQKLKSNIGLVFPKDIAMLNSVRAPQADPGVCLLFWSSLWIFAFSLSLLSSLSFPYLVPCHSSLFITFSSSSPQITVWRRLRLLVLWMHIRGKPGDQKDFFKRAIFSHW